VSRGACGPAPVPSGLDPPEYTLHLIGRALVNDICAYDREKARARAARQREARRAAKAENTDRGDT
jgi:hypothetical protein